jgi:hypothetical protein
MNAQDLQKHDSKIISVKISFYLFLPEQNLFNLLSKIGQFLLLPMLTETLKGSIRLFCMSVFCLLFVLFPNPRLKTHHSLIVELFLKLSGSLPIAARKGKEQNKTLEGYRFVIHKNKLCYRYRYEQILRGYNNTKDWSSS